MKSIFANFARLTLGNNEPIWIKADEITAITKDTQHNNTNSVVYVKGREVPYRVLEDTDEVINELRISL